MLHDILYVSNVMGVQYSEYQVFAVRNDTCTVVICIRHIILPGKPRYIRMGQIESDHHPTLIFQLLRRSNIKNRRNDATITRKYKIAAHCFAPITSH